MPAFLEYDLPRIRDPQDLWSGYGADLVVLGFVFNDVYYKYLHKPHSQKFLGREPSAHLHHFNPDNFPGMLFARSHLAHEIASFGEVIWKRIVGRPVFSFERRGDFYLAWKPYGWKWVRDLIGEMHSLLQAKGISLVVLVFPVTDQVNESYRIADEAYVLYPQYSRDLRRLWDTHP